MPWEVILCSVVIVLDASSLRVRGWECFPLLMRTSQIASLNIGWHRAEDGFRGEFNIGVYAVANRLRTGPGPTTPVTRRHWRARAMAHVPIVATPVHASKYLYKLH